MPCRLLALLLFLALPLLATAQARFSVILEGGTVYDGSGGPGVVADVGLIGERVAAIGDLRAAAADRRLDVRGLAVAPGFLDIHSHATSGTPARSGIVQRPLAENYLRQGVTTVLGGQDGGSPADIGTFLAALDTSAFALNVGVFIGHGTTRRQVMGNEDRAPQPDELAAMQRRVRQAMIDGAFGLSSGLEYTPGAYAETDELVALAREVAPFGGLYISHIRDEGGRALESVAEVIEIGEQAGVAAQVTHHKIVGPNRWGRSAETLRLIDEARARGVDVTSDVYPYTASSTGLSILFPRWSLEGTGEAVRARFTDPATRARIETEIADHIRRERGGDPATIVTATCRHDPSLDGLSLAGILERQGQAATVEAAAALAVDLQLAGGCQAVLHSMSEEDVSRLLAHPHTMVSSDGGIPALNVGVPHPRNYGAFARVLAYFVREKGVLPLPDAIHKMTGLPATRLGLTDRGFLRPGYHADLVIFDPATVQDHATFAQPHQYATGVRHVFVNGTQVLRDGEPTGARPGAVLRRFE